MKWKILLAILVTMIMLIAPLTAISKPTDTPYRGRNKQDFLLNLLTAILEKIEEKTGRTPPGLARLVEWLSERNNDEDETPPDDEEGNDCDCDGFEGCGIGFWKNHLNVWINYTSDQQLKEIFEFPTELEDLENSSLLEALKFKGGKGIEGKARILLKQAVAALLNAAHPDVNYSLNVSEIIIHVNDTLRSLNTTEMLELKDVFDEYNNLGSDLCGCKEED
jgi:hypothetical protein